MADETIQTTETTETETQTAELKNPFEEGAWEEKPSLINNGGEEIQTPAATIEKKEEKPEFNQDTFVKENFGFENLEQAKTEFENLKKLKDKPTASEIKFENEKSEKFFNLLKEGDSKKKELYDYLSKEMELERVETLDITNTVNAAEVIRANYRHKHTELTEDEVSDMFEENYSKPEKPEQKFDEDAADYDKRVERWQRECEAVDKKIVRDAKIARPELLQTKSKIVLPDIPKKEEGTPKQRSQEELAAEETYRQTFLQSVETGVKDFAGFSVQAKVDKDVDLSVNYGLSAEEKQSVSGQLKSLAENGFDVNTLFAQRWVNEDNSLNTAQMIKDLSMLAVSENLLKKIASDAAAKRLEAHLKDKKNINVDGNTQGEVQLTDQPDKDKMVEHFFDN